MTTAARAERLGVGRRRGRRRTRGRSPHRVRGRMSGAGRVGERVARRRRSRWPRRARVARRRACSRSPRCTRRSGARAAEERAGRRVARSASTSQVRHERVRRQVGRGVVAAGDVGDGARVVRGVARAGQQDRLLPEVDPGERGDENEGGDGDDDDHAAEDVHERMLAALRCGIRRAESRSCGGIHVAWDSAAETGFRRAVRADAAAERMPRGGRPLSGRWPSSRTASGAASNWPWREESGLRSFCSGAERHFGTSALRHFGTSATSAPK